MTFIRVAAIVLALEDGPETEPNDLSLLLFNLGDATYSC